MNHMKLQNYTAVTNLTDLTFLQHQTWWTVHQTGMYPNNAHQFL